MVKLLMCVKAKETIRHTVAVYMVLAPTKYMKTYRQPSALLNL